MNSLDRRAAIAAYKKRERAVGVFAFRCAPTGQVWVGQTPNLDTILNRLRFTLERGSHSVRALQEAWRAHGADAFAFEVLERIGDEETAYLLSRLLKEAALRWRERLGAGAL